MNDSEFMVGIAEKALGLSPSAAGGREEAIAKAKDEVVREPEKKLAERFMDKKGVCLNAFSSRFNPEDFFITVHQASHLGADSVCFDKSIARLLAKALLTWTGPAQRREAR